jgi:hypothetical protein
MRFMMFMLPDMPGQADPESPQMPTAEAVSAMSKYNDELTKAGVLLSLDGLHPQWEGARVSFSGGRSTVIDGPFTEAKEAIGGYWLIQVKSKEEAIEWAKRVPAVDGDFTIEVRQVFDMEEFPPDVQEAAGV